MSPGTSMYILKGSNGGPAFWFTEGSQRGSNTKVQSFSKCLKASLLWTLENKYPFALSSSVNRKTAGKSAERFDWLPLFTVKTLQKLANCKFTFLHN